MNDARRYVYDKLIIGDFERELIFLAQISPAAGARGGGPDAHVYPKRGTPATTCHRGQNDASDNIR